MVITKKLKMELTGRQLLPAVDVMQNDASTRAVEFRLYENEEAWNVPAGVTASVSYKKPDGTVGLYDTLPDGSPAVSIDGSTVTAILAPQALAVPGPVHLSVILRDEPGRQLATFGLIVSVHENPGSALTESDDYINVHTFLPQPSNTAAVGQHLQVQEVTAFGRVVKLKAVDAPGGSGSGNAVLYTEQVLTDAQKAQARENIGAAAEGEGGNGGGPGEDGGYYTPAVSAEGVLTWTPSKNGMPSVEDVNIRGPVGAPGEDGKDGVSPSVSITDIEGGHRVGITDASGTKTFDVMDGADGQDGSGGSITVDSALNPNSTNPVQNKVIVALVGEIEQMLMGLTPDAELSESSTNPVQNKVIYAQLVQAQAALEQILRMIPTDTHINSLIDAKLGVIENGAY